MLEWPEERGEVTRGERGVSPQLSGKYMRRAEMMLEDSDASLRPVSRPPRHRAEARGETRVFGEPVNVGVGGTRLSS